MSRNPAPPAGLSERSQALWRAIVRAGTRSRGRLTLVEECLIALDQATHYRKLLEGQELLVTTPKSGAMRMHPLTRASAEAVERFARLAKLIGLEWDDELDGDETPSV
jgi:phage terminase small subunit